MVEGRGKKTEVARMCSAFKNVRGILITVLTGLFLTGAVLVQEHASQAKDLSGKDTQFKSVEPGDVCMVNDRVTGMPQIPVEVEGKTYYGCCENCVTRLQSDRSVRFSIDPVTGREVDKATAFIVSAPGGAALYFESAETARKYLSSNSPGSAK
jgi:YHS domain-containing protein